MRLPLSIAVAIVIAGAMVQPARGQSLGDIARQEEARRKDVKAPGKVYSNKDLSGPQSTPSSQDTTKAEAPATAPAAAKDGAKAADGSGKDNSKDQTYWAKRKKELQDKLDRDKNFADAMQTRVNALTADFAARADPVQRAAVERDRQKALAELARLQQDIKNDVKALADLDEEARKAGVAPGWLR